MFDIAERDQEWYVESSGELVQYPQIYNLTAEQRAHADELLEEVRRQKANAEISFLRLGQALDVIEREQLYKAHGVPSFRAWVMSPNIDLSYRVAADLLRIVREVIPILPENTLIPSVSTLRELLPILADEQGSEKFVEALHEVEGLNVRDTRERVKELRGTARPYDEATPAIFQARVQRGEEYHRVTVTCGTGTDYYTVGTLNIRPRDWSRWENRFGAFIEYTE